MEKLAVQFNVKFLLALTAVVAVGLMGWQMQPMTIALPREVSSLLLWLYFTAPLMLFVVVAVMDQIRWSKRMLIGLLAASAVLVVGCFLGNDNPIITSILFGAPIVTSFCLFECMRALLRRTTIATFVFWIVARIYG